MAFQVVYRITGLAPRNLSAVRFHGERKGGDLSHVTPPEQYKEMGRSSPMVMCFDGRGRFHNDESFDWVNGIQNEVKAAARANTEAQVKSLYARGKAKEARRRAKQGDKQPYREQKSGGPLREILLSANAAHFQKENGKPGEWDKKKVREFIQHGTKFLQNEWGNSLRYLRVDLDEEGPHFHAIAAPWEATKTRTGVEQQRLQPTSRSNYDTEKAQDRVGEAMSAAGLRRGERASQARRDARERGQASEPKRNHIAPAEWRRQQEAELSEREKTLSMRERRAAKILAIAADIDVTEVADQRNIETIHHLKVMNSQQDISKSEAIKAATDAKKMKISEQRRQAAIAKFAKENAIRARIAKATRKKRAQITRP